MPRGCTPDKSKANLVFRARALCHLADGDDAAPGVRECFGEAAPRSSRLLLHVLQRNLRSGPIGGKRRRQGEGGA